MLLDRVMLFSATRRVKERAGGGWGLESAARAACVVRCCCCVLSLLLSLLLCVMRAVTACDEHAAGAGAEVRAGYANNDGGVVGWCREACAAKVAAAAAAAAAATAAPVCCCASSATGAHTAPSRVVKAVPRQCTAVQPPCLEHTMVAAAELAATAMHTHTPRTRSPAHPLNTAVARRDPKPYANGRLICNHT